MTASPTRSRSRALERKGFLHVVPDEDDARVRRLVVTEKSREYWRGRSGEDQRTVAEWFSALSDDEAATLFELLSRLDAGVRAGDG